MRAVRTFGIVLGALVCAGLAAAPAAFADVTAGEVITPANKQKVEGLIPKEIYPYVVQNFKQLDMRITATGHYPQNPKYVEATVKYACQARIDKNGNIENYTAGQPFPYSDWATKATNHACDLKTSDPQFALKLAWDVNYRWQGPGLNLPHWGFSYERNAGRETWQVSQGEYRRTYFSHRADLLPETTKIEPNTDVEWAEFFDVKTPYNLRGTMFLLYRYLDSPKKADDTWAYIPALRRVRRIAATQKSDALLGTEFTLEDFYLFSGYVWDHEWQFKGEHPVLAVMNSKRKCFPEDVPDQHPDRFGAMGTRAQWDHCQFGPYGVFPFIGENWEKRTAFELDDIPKEKGHPYSRKKIWYDKETLTPLMAIAYDRAGSPYRILWQIGKWSEDSPYPRDHNKDYITYAGVMIANVQNNASNMGQFYTGNAISFSRGETERYYDTARLKRGRR